MSDQPRAPGLEHIGGLLVDIALSKAKTMLPGRVVSYDATAGSVVVELLVMETHLDETEDDVSETVSQIADVPVAFYGGNANRITVPVKAGDLGRVVFASRDIAKWKLTGGVVNPDSPRVHDINDCVFEPGLHVLGKMPTTAPDDAIVMHGSSKVGGPTGTQKTYMADTHSTAFDTLLDGMTAFVSAFNVFFLAMSTDVALGVVAPVTYAAAAALQPLILNMNAAIVAFKAGNLTYKTQLAEVK